MSEQKLQNFMQQKLASLKKNLFKVGCIVDNIIAVHDLLGIDAKSFGTGLRVYVEDETKLASSLLGAQSTFETSADGVLYDIKSNNIVFAHTDIVTFEVLKNFAISILSLDFECFFLKTFGLTQSALETYLKEFKLINNIFEYYIEENMLDALIIIRFSRLIATKLRQPVIASIVKDLNKHFYSDQDISLSNAACQILSIQKQKIAIAESFTAGLITATFARENKDYQNVICRSFIVDSNNTKIEMLGLDVKLIEKFTAVSPEVAFEMAVGLLNKTSCDIAIASTGYLFNEDSAMQGLFYSGLGDKNAVHIYSHKYDFFDGDELLKISVNVMLFELITKLKKNAYANLEIAK